MRNFSAKRLRLLSAGQRRRQVRADQRKINCRHRVYFLQNIDHGKEQMA
jgi:hypothetical protein